MVPMGASRHQSNKHVFLIFHPYWKPSLCGQLMVLCPAASASLLSSYFWSAEMASSKKTLGSLELEDVRKSRIVRHSRSGMMEPVVAHFTAGISSGYCKPNASAISTLSRSLLKEKRRHGWQLFMSLGCLSLEALTPSPPSCSSSWQALAKKLVCISLAIVRAWVNCWRKFRFQMFLVRSNPTRKSLEFSL